MYSFISGWGLQIMGISAGPSYTDLDGNQFHVEAKDKGVAIWSPDELKRYFMLSKEDALRLANDLVLHAEMINEAQEIPSYRLCVDSQVNHEAKKGTIVYMARNHDYGLASDDTRSTGIQHVSVTLDPSGDYPFFTIPVRDLEPL